MRHTAGFIISVVLGVSAATANAKECTKMEAYAAESVTSYLDSWKNVNLAFKEFGHCDDGAIAEGFDEAISLLWAEKWNKVSEMLKYTNADKAFESFVFKRIAAEDIPDERWKRIAYKAKTSCPKDGGTFCTAIIRSVRTKADNQ